MAWGIYDTEQDTWATPLAWTKDAGEALRLSSEAEAVKWIADHGLDETVRPMRLENDDGK